MSQRDQILRAIRGNQPELTPVPDLPRFDDYFGDPLVKFSEVLTMIGANAVRVADFESIRTYLPQHFDLSKPVFSTIPELSELAFANAVYGRAQDLHTTELFILPAEFGVAENGAVWLTDAGLPERAVPFIPEHLAVVIPRHAILRTMHEAYERIGQQAYGWAAFIAGPSKTADIEQSLVLGAHGPRSMTVLILG